MSMAKTVVGLMEDTREAESVVRDLTASCGCDRGDIGLMARGQERGAPEGNNLGGRDEDNFASGALKGAGAGAAIGGVLGLVAGVASLSIPGLGPLIAAGPIASALAGAGIGAAAGGLIGGLMQLGVPEEEAHYYAEGVRRGGTLITVNAASDKVADCAANVMREHGAVDIDERAAQWKQSGWGGRFADAQGQVLPVAQEELAIGKRQVSKGGVRVYSHVTETPVEETVHLREERAKVERHRVDRPVGSGDDAFREKSFEVRETAEEPVVDKRSRITEEVRVGKQATEHDQTIRDKVRKTEVRTERQGAAGSGTRSAYAGPDRRKNKAPYTGQDRRMAFR
jgi:uncharacterized protein (TIGR02271 family)